MRLSRLLPCGPASSAGIWYGGGGMERAVWIGRRNWRGGREERRIEGDIGREGLREHSQCLQWRPIADVQVISKAEKATSSLAPRPSILLSRPARQQRWPPQLSQSRASLPRPSSQILVPFSFLLFLTFPLSLSPNPVESRKERKSTPLGRRKRILVFNPRLRNI